MSSLYSINFDDFVLPELDNYLPLATLADPTTDHTAAKTNGTTRDEDLDSVRSQDIETLASTVGTPRTTLQSDTQDASYPPKSRLPVAATENAPLPEERGASRQTLPASTKQDPTASGAALLETSPPQSVHTHKAEPLTAGAERMQRGKSDPEAHHARGRYGVRQSRSPLLEIPDNPQGSRLRARRPAAIRSPSPSIVVTSEETDVVGPLFSGEESSSPRQRLTLNTTMTQVSPSSLLSAPGSAPGSRRSRSRSDSTSTNTEAVCDACGQLGRDRFRCNMCKEVYCDGCWIAQRCHRTEAAALHEKTEEHLYQKVKDCFTPPVNDKDRDKAHEGDIQTTWFGVAPDDGGRYPLLKDYGRFADIVASIRDIDLGTSPILQSMETLNGAMYPTLASFVGETGAGKSTLIKLLIDLRPEDLELLPTPVVGTAHSTDPTSEDVHLYLGPGLENNRIRLFADCEGLHGGERNPVGAKVKLRKFKLAQEAREREGKNRSQRHATERELIWANEPQKKRREFTVGHLYPRLLYTFSDVIVFVHRNPKTIEGVLILLLEWAAAAIETSSNQPVLPHAIIVFNAMDHRNDADFWDPEKATREVLSSLTDVVTFPTFKKHTDFWMRRQRRVQGIKQLLESYYASITIVRVPTEDRPNLLKAQVQQLQRLIKAASDVALEKRMHLRMLLDAQEYEAHLMMAFDHFALTLDKPFDFVKASFAHSPIPNNFAGNIVKLALGVWTRWMEKSVRGQDIFEELSYMIASCIMLDATRNKIKGTAEVLFPQYLDHIDEALDNFCNQHWPCESVFRGERCVNVCVGHRKGHQAKTGKILAPGEWTSTFNYEAYNEEFREQIYGKLQELLQMVHARQQAFEQHEIQATAAVHRSEVLTKFFNGVTSGSPNSLTSHSVCYCCLFEAPAHPLPCGHIICTPCLMLYGTDFGRNRSYSISECPMEKNNPFRDPWTINLRPPSSGIRVLTLDGGGVRGIVELEILRNIESVLGPPLKIKHFFDLVVGTSAGGIIALGLIACNMTLEQCTTSYRNLTKQAFTPRKGSKLKLLGKAIDWYHHSKYQTTTLETALKDVFTETKTLFGDPAVLGPYWAPDWASRNDVKIAITATSSMGQPVIFTNYNRICNERLPYTLYRPRSSEDELRLFEIARSTSAAPTYFKPYHHAKTKQVFVDGGVYYNNPINVAEHERKLIWPNVQTEHPDIVLSVGSSRGPRRLKEAEEKHSDTGLFSHGQFMYKFAVNRIHNAMDSEAAWDEFKSIKAPNAENIGRYQRFNPVMTTAAPKLDQISSMDSLEKFARDDMGTKATLRPFVRRLVATLFYFEPESSTSRPDSNQHEVTGTIMCRFANGNHNNQKNEEIRAVARFIQENVVTKGFKPCFKISLKGNDTQLLQTIEITASLIDPMLKRGFFRMQKCSIAAPHTSLTTVITLCYNEGEEYPISGFPRKLHEERECFFDRRQILRPSDSTRWNGRSNSQRERKQWRPSTSVRRSMTVGRIAQYNGAHCLLRSASSREPQVAAKHGTAEQKPFSGIRNTTYELPTYDQACPKEPAISELPGSDANAELAGESFGAESAYDQAYPEESAVYELSGSDARSELAGEWPMAELETALPRVQFYARATQSWSSIESDRQWLDVCVDDVIAIVKDENLFHWYGSNTRTKKYGWISTNILSLIGEAHSQPTNSYLPEALPFRQM